MEVFLHIHTKKFELIIRIVKYTILASFFRTVVLPECNKKEKETNVLKKEEKIVKMKSTLRLHVYVVWVKHSGLKFSLYCSLF